MEREPIYVAGYPKSGTTWLTRLLADCLDCAAGGCMPKEDGKEMASEGWNRPEPYVVRKGHFVLTDEGDSLVPRPHRMVAEHHAGEPVVFILRDPRDVAVSGSYHWGAPTIEFLHAMVKGVGPVRAIGPWIDYNRAWLKSPLVRATVKYEWMKKDAVREMLRLVGLIGGHADRKQIKEAVHRQSFTVRRAWIRAYGDRLNLGRAHNMMMMRKGKVGDWKVHFDRECIKYANEHLRGPMEEMGYVW